MNRIISMRIGKREEHEKSELITYYIGKMKCVRITDIKIAFNG